MGIGTVALGWLLNRDKLLATPPAVPRGEQSFDLTPKQPHHTPKAQAMISLFMHGGPSHMDLTDPKPELQRMNGKTYQGDIQFSDFKNGSKRLMGSRWKFHKHGECGTEISELLPNISGIVDDICLIRSMHTGYNGHEVSIRYMHSGIPSVTGRPTLGSWLLYGLGSETNNLPSYMVMTDPGGHPVDSVHNWSNGWMPTLFQGTVLRPKDPRILNLDAPAHLRGRIQEENLGFLEKLNRRHLKRHPGERDLEARIASYELAARMQTAAKEALDISHETEQTHKLYGLDDDATREYGTRCLIARRMVERGVRFVQIYHRGWDVHQFAPEVLPAQALDVDRAAWALIQDLKERGLFDETLVIWGGEFGRTIYSQGKLSDKNHGRDHHGRCFTTWLAGGGVKAGFEYGKTDDHSYNILENPVHIRDLNATILHCLGIDHQRLTYRFQGRDFRLTDVHGNVVRDLLS